MDGPGKRFEPPKAADMLGKITVLALIALFLVLIIVLFFHLYTKWFWWRIEEPSPPPRRRRFVFAPGQEASLSVRTSKGLDSAVLASLPLLIFRQEDFKDGLECAVCLSEFEEGEEARILPKCNHGFHVDCIDMWFLSHSTCPLCRNPVAGSQSDSDPIDSLLDVINLESPDENQISTERESPDFPTNVLFWGDETEEGVSSASFASSSLPSRPEGMLVIDVPMNVSDNLSEGESKSPMPTRLRSLKRLLSRATSSSSSVDV